MDRLSLADAQILKQETDVVGGHGTGALIFDRPESGDESIIEPLRERVAHRLDGLPRCRQRIRRAPLDLLPPIWEDDPQFDLTNHIIPVEQDHELTDEELRQLVGRVTARRLDLERPLWRVDVVERVAGDRVALIASVHHAMADGAAVILMLMTLFTDYDDGADGKTSWRPSPPLGELDVVRDGLSVRSKGYVEVAHSVAESIRSTDALKEMARSAAQVPAVIGRQFRPRRRLSPFNDKISAERDVAYFSCPWDSIKQVRSNLGPEYKVNDIFLAVLAAGVRHWMTTTGRPIEDVRVKVPVGMARAEGELGNVDSLMYIDLPVTQRDPVACLDAIVRASTECKDGRDAEIIHSAFEFLGKISGLLYNAASRAQISSRLFAFEVSNNRGANARITMFGGLCRDVHWMTNIAQRHAVRVTFSTGLDRVFLTLCVDPRAFPEVQILCDGIESGIKELVEASRRASAARQPPS